MHTARIHDNSYSRIRKLFIQGYSMTKEAQRHEEIQNKLLLFFLVSSCLCGSSLFNMMASWTTQSARQDRVWPILRAPRCQWQYPRRILSEVFSTALSHLR